MSCSTTSLESFAYETNITSLGRLEIKPLVSADEIQPACTVMVRAFSGGEEQLTLTGASSYAREVLMPSGLQKGALLVARLFPLDASCLPPNQESRVIAACTLSLHPDTKQKYPSLPPPSSSTYLANMAVDVKFRRRGVAKRLLEAAADYTQRVRGRGTQIYLHVRQVDQGTIELYKGFGFREVARDEPGLFKKTSTLRILMRLDLEASSIIEE